MRHTPKKTRHQKAMDRAVEMVAETGGIPIGGAVDRAMERHHAENPARYHSDRPSLAQCPYNESCPFVDPG